MSNSISKGNIRIMDMSECEEREKGAESLFKEIIPESFPSLGKGLDIQGRTANRTSNYLNAKRPYPRYIVLKQSKSMIKKEF